MQGAMRRYGDRAAHWAAIGAGFTIPFPVALNNTFVALMLCAWALGGGFREKFAAFRHPAALAGIALYAVITLGALYGEASAATAALHLRKYTDLLLIPIFLFLFRDGGARRLALQGLALSLAFIVVLSSLIKLGVPLGLASIQGYPDDPVVFKGHLTHNILIAFGVFLYAWLAMCAESRWAVRTWTLLAAFAFANVTIMVHGATGYLVLGALLLLLGYRKLSWRGTGAAVLALTALAFALMTFTNPFQQRVTKIAGELQEWTPLQPAASSTGWRLEFYSNTLSLIADHPVAGVGTGGFAPAYAKKVEGTGKVATTNPHNEFLLMWAQLGIAGLVVLIWMFWRQWRLAAQLPTRLESELARGLVVTMVIGCMLNSLLLDHTEGLFYAWLTGVLYGGLKSAHPDNDARSTARATSATPV